MLNLTSKRGDLFVLQLALGIIFNNFRHADDFAMGIFDRRNSQRNLNQTPALALPNGFMAFHAWPERMQEARR